MTYTQICKKGAQLLVVFGLLFLGTAISAQDVVVNLEDQKPITLSGDSDPNPMAPNFELQTIQGETVRLSDYRGKAVLLNFWATWCGPCRVEIPDFIELTNTRDTDKFVILGMTLQSGTPDQIRKFAEKMGMNYPVLYGEDATMMKLAELYNQIQAIPTTFLIGPDGRVRKHYVGPRDGETFWQDIQAVVN